MLKPFWEKSYKDLSVSTFAKGPTADVAEFSENLKPNSMVLDVCCGEGRNSIFLAEKGHIVERDYLA
jgi:tellurite methyltransferase